jgi:TPP-dependent pyruvate/acetoin dehydrogenase alpha subunit
VPKALLESWAARDPIARYRQSLIDEGYASRQDLEDVDDMAKDLAAEEAGAAEDAAPPDPSTVARGVYAGDDFARPRLEFVASPFADA